LTIMPDDATAAAGRLPIGRLCVEDTIRLPEPREVAKLP